MESSSGTMELHFSNMELPRSNMESTSFRAEYIRFHLELSLSFADKSAGKAVNAGYFTDNQTESGVPENFLMMGKSAHCRAGKFPGFRIA